MYKLQTFWHVFRHSIVPFDYYYHKVRSVRFTFSLTYFVALVALLVFITSSAVIASFITLYPKERLTSLVASLELQYPKDLVITMMPQGTLTTNSDMPFTLFSPIASNPIPLIVVDPRAHKEDFYAYDSPLVLTEKHMYAHILGNLYTYDYSPEPNRFTAQDAKQVQAGMLSLLEWYPWIVLASYALFLVVGFFVVLTTHIVLAFVLSIVVLLFYTIARRVEKPAHPIQFTRVFQIALHTMTAPLLLGVIFIVSPLTPTIPFWYIIAHILFLLAGTYEAYFAKKERLVA